MRPSWTHIAVIIYYTYKLPYFFWGSRGLHISHCFYFLSMGLMPSRDTQKSKYYILVCPKNDFSILHLGHFYFSLLSANSRFCTLSLQYNFVMIKKLSTYARMNYNPLNKSFVFYLKMSGKLATSIGRRL